MPFEPMSSIRLRSISTSSTWPAEKGISSGGVSTSNGGGATVVMLMQPRWLIFT